MFRLSMDNNLLEKIADHERIFPTDTKFSHLNYVTYTQPSLSLSSSVQIFSLRVRSYFPTTAIDHDVIVQ